MRDLTEYKHFAKRLGGDLVQQKFAILRDIANIFIVEQENLQTLIDDSALSHLEREELLALLHRRRADPSAKTPLRSPISSPQRR